MKGAKNSKKTGYFILGQEALSTFRVLKEVFQKVLVLAYFILGRYTIVETDISAFAIVGVISQLVREDTEAY